MNLGVEAGVEISVRVDVILCNDVTLVSENVDVDVEVEIDVDVLDDGVSSATASREKKKQY